MVALVRPSVDKWSTPSGLYDPGFIAYLGFIFDPSRAVIDIGANIGAIALFLARRTRQPVICFEPAPSTFEALEANTASVENIVRHRVALGAKGGDGWLVGDGTVTAHLTQPGGRGYKVPVDVVRLDQAVPPDLNIGLVKIDVEGTELDVLRGAARVLTDWSPLLAIETIDSHLQRGKGSRQAIFEYLAQYGYTRAVNKYGMVETALNPTGASDTFFLPGDWYAPRLYIGYERLLRKQQGHNGVREPDPMPEHSEAAALGSLWDQDG